MTALFVSNYSGTGIGDFGMELASRLRFAGIRIELEETSTTRKGAFDQFSRILRNHGIVITNLGLTSWGSSGLLNFAGFLSVGLRAFLGRPTIVLLHTAIEVIDQRSSGFRIGFLTRLGAHYAVRTLSRSKIVVFSNRVDEVLRRKYGLTPVVTTPIPCHNFESSIQRPLKPAIVLTPGYLSPYKGVDVLAAVRPQVRGDCQFVVVGGPHRLLRHEPEYSKSLEVLDRKLHGAGISTLGWIPDQRLDELIQSSTLALLPYRATQGGSAMFARLASGGLPVVAASLSEFEWLKSQGAGIVTCDATPTSFARAIDGLLSDPSALGRLSRKQADFAGRYSWNEFVRTLMRLMSSLEPSDQLNHP